MKNIGYDDVVSIHIQAKNEAITDIMKRIKKEPDISDNALIFIHSCMELLMHIYEDEFYHKLYWKGREK